MCGFFHEWNSNSMYFSLAWRCRLPNTFTLIHTHRQTPILLIPRQTQICCFMNDYQEQQLNFRCALLITSFFRLPFFLSLFAVCLFLDNTNVLVSINVRAPISRKVNAATVSRAHEWTTLFVPLYLAVFPSLCLSLFPSICVATRVFLRFI